MSSRTLVRLVVILAVCVTLISGRAADAQQDVLPWEYRPYQIHCWLAIDPALKWNPDEIKLVSQETIEAIESRFGPAASVTSARIPLAFEGDVLYSSETFSLDVLLGRELVLVTSKIHPDGKEARTVAAALEKFQSIAINAASLDSMRSDLAAHPDFKEGEHIGSRLKAAEGPTTDSKGNDPVAQDLVSGKIPIAMIARSIAKANANTVRLVPLVYPWQLQSELNTRDKILTICFHRTDVGIAIEVREIDCLFRSVGRLAKSEVTTNSEIGDAIAYLSGKAFIPFVRMESADEKMAKVRVRAGELIPKDSLEYNPCYIRTGDVLRPTIRRDAMNGEPSLIQAIPWTYLVAIDEQSSNMNCAIYAGVRGSLLGRPNRRLHRMALLVKPTYESTDLQLRVAAKPKPVVAGSSIFRRTPGSDDLVLMGRSDWRGILHITQMENPIVEYDLPASEASAAATAPQKPTGTNPTAPASNQASAPNPPPSTSDTKANEKQAASTTEQKSNTPPATKPVVAKGKIQANVPLYFYFIKSGNALLGKVPIVTGDEPLQIAELADDSKRLEAEAFIRGLEGRIFDIVALRLILQQRIEDALADGKPASLKEAQKLLGQLKITKDYDSFSQDLDSIQQRIYASESSTPIPKGAKKRIDRMIEDTRTNLQKYLQNSRVGELELRLIELRKKAGIDVDSATGSTSPTEESRLTSGKTAPDQSTTSN